MIGVLPVTGKPGAYVSKRYAYNKTQYHPVLKKNLSGNQISLCDDQGKRIRFRKEKSDCDFAFTTQKAKFVIKTRCKGKCGYCKKSTEAETCVSNIVVPQRLTKTIICLKSVMECLILRGHECNKVMD